jgi:PAS domain S-box-containing protein
LDKQKRLAEEEHALRPGRRTGGIVLLVATLAAAGVLLALVLRMPGTAALHHAGQLGLASLQVALALGDSRARALGDTATPALGDATALPAPLQHAVAALDALLRDVAASDDPGALPAAELAAFEARWRATQALLAAPDGHAATARALVEQQAAAQALAARVQQRLDARQQQVELALKSLVAVLALLLAWPILGLWRQRQRVRASLQHFSSGLGSGDWHDAVRTLREERLGAPSAFDALASGVEGVLGESERRWKALAELSADWYWETDERHAISWLSGSAPVLSVQGWQAAEVIGRRRDQIAACEPPAEGWEHFHRRLERHEPFRDLEFRVTDRQRRHRIWVSISGRPRLDAEGRFRGYEGVGRDVTERRAAHERLVASEQRWSLMAGLASDWYWQTDAEHRLLPLAPELVRRFGERADSFVGLTRWDAFRDAMTPEQWAEHRADLEARRPFRALQFEVELAPGQFIWLSISGLPRFDGSGRFLGYHGVGRDISMRKQAERLLLRHNEELQRSVAERTRELERLNLDLDAFARQLAHELRTPIGHVQGLAHLLETRARDRLDAEDRQLLELQVQAARSMRDTVDALLQLARSTMLPMPMETVDVSALAHAVVDELPPLKRHGALHWDIQPALRATAAPAALRIVLANLLGNAAKFTRHCTQPVVRLSGRGDGAGRLCVRVEDNGAGFDPAQAGRLFQPFQRLHTGEDFAGTGIGLTIVQRIVERHGGRVAASGMVGHGACFEFTLAAAPPLATERPVTAASA